MKYLLLTALGLSLVIACGDSENAPDSGTLDTGMADTATLDTAASDTATADANQTDSGTDFQSFGPCAAESDYQKTTPTIALADGSFEYEPKCLQVVAGTTVSILDTGSHPLAASDRGSTNNPIMGRADKAGSDMVEIAFPNVGFFPYYCSNHGNNDGSGMAGVVWVRE